MNARVTTMAMAAILAVVLSLHISGQTRSAGSTAANEGPPRRADGKPDLSGVWMPPYVPDMTVNRRDQRGYAEPPFSPDDTPQARQALYAKGNKAELPLTASGLADWSAYDAATASYTGSCFPFGLQRSVNAPYPFQMMQDERQVALLFEINTWHHVIPITREFPKQMADNPTWSPTRSAAGRATRSWSRRAASTATRAWTRWGTSAQRRHAPDADVQARRRHDHGVYGDHRRSENLHEALDQRAHLPAERWAADRYSVRGEQPQPLGGADHELVATVVEAEAPMWRAFSSRVVNATAEP